MKLLHKVLLEEMLETYDELSSAHAKVVGFFNDMGQKMEHQYGVFSAKLVMTYREIYVVEYFVKSRGRLTGAFWWGIDESIKAVRHQYVKLFVRRDEAIDSGAFCDFLALMKLDGKGFGTVVVANGSIGNCVRRGIVLNLGMRTGRIVARGTSHSLR